MAGSKRSADSKTQAREAAVDRLVAQLGGQGPVLLGTLFAAAGAALDRPTAAALARRASVFARSVDKITLAELESVHAAAKGEAAEAVGSDAVLAGLLRRLAITRKTRAHTASQLVSAVSARDQAALRTSLAARVRERRWPEGVGAVLATRGVVVFLLEDVASGAPSRGAPAARPAATSFASSFDEAFDRLRRERGLNLVELSALRSALGRWSREDFDRGLRALRQESAFVLHTFDGRHGRLSPEEQAGAIEEGGRRFVYAARREEG